MENAEEILERNGRDFGKKHEILELNRRDFGGEQAKLWKEIDKFWKERDTIL